ncbi:Ras- protein rsr1 [Orbilia javanica]|uniref:Ras- protein rsr1 n=1 Tax=Orbilia javanica TaxID=47235 RepID=A0AAN8NN22_9PEZI
MSAPNVNSPNEGIVGQITNSIKNAGQYVAETVNGKAAEVSKEQNKEQAKGNVPGKTSLSDRASGVLGAASDKLDQTTHETSARANKEGI